VKATRAYFTPKGKLLAFITRAHRALYRASRGIVGGTLYVMGEKGSGTLLRPMHVLLLTTTGHKSGEPRTVPLPYFEWDGRTFIVGSFAGGDAHPAWFKNAVAKPEVEMQIGGDTRRARALPLEGEERERYWSRLVAEWPRYGVYQTKTSRRIPLVELAPLTTR
jgi:deazaflavin-dependent oxidoreductase (nitroreductase family)